MQPGLIFSKVLLEIKTSLLVYHPLSVLHILLRVTDEQEPIPANIVREAGYTPDRSSGVVVRNITRSSSRHTVHRYKHII